MKTVDVVIPTYKPGKGLRRLLRQLDHQDYPVNKIYIANTDSSYWKADLVPDMKTEITVIQIPKGEFDHGGTRNQMAQMSDADYILFLTQDALIQNKRLVGTMLRDFSDPSVACVYGRQLPKKNCAALEQKSREFNYPPESRKKTKEDLDELGIKTYFCSNVCAMYDREKYRELGGFVTHTIFNEDMIYAAGVINAGLAVYYEADACVYHSHNYTIGRYFSRCFDMAVSQADHPEIFKTVKSEKEGMRLVKNVTEEYLQKKEFGQLYCFFTQCAVKYAGYLFGKNYKKLPEEICVLCSENKAYWKKNK